MSANVISWFEEATGFKREFFSSSKFSGEVKGFLGFGILEGICSSSWGNIIYKPLWKNFKIKFK